MATRKKAAKKTATSAKPATASRKAAGKNRVAATGKFGDRQASPAKNAAGKKGNASAAKSSGFLPSSTTARSSKSASSSTPRVKPGIANKKTRSASTTRQPPATKALRPVAEKLHALTPAGRKESFFELVFEVARQIPRGRVTSYGAIAASLGARSSSRMVGWAMNGAGRVRPVVPAHRVVNRNGMLSGKHHFATPTRMQELLEKEGIQVKKDTVVNFKELFWDPAQEGF